MHHRPTPQPARPHQPVIALIRLLFLAIFVLSPFLTAAQPERAQAARRVGVALGTDILTINGGGGGAANGSDGLRIAFNCTGGTEQVWFRDLVNYFDGDCGYGTASAGTGGNVGITLSIQQGVEAAMAFSSLFGDATWSNVEVLALSGTASVGSAMATTTGSGYALLEYTAVKPSGTAAGTYRLQREISYTYPNKYFSEKYTVFVPVGNPGVTLRVYKGGDTYPGGSDSGTGKGVSTPYRTIMSIEPTSKQVLAFRETTGGTLFGGYSGLYTNGTNIMQASEDIGVTTCYNTCDAYFDVDSAFIDTGIVAQFKATGVTYSANGTVFGLDTVVQKADVSVSAAFDTAVANSSANLVFTVQNSYTDAAATATDLTFDFALPAPLTISGAATEDCTVTSMTGGVGDSAVSVVTDVFPGYTCTISYPVSVPSAQVVTLTNSMLTNLSVGGVDDASSPLEASNNTGTSSVNFTFGAATATATAIGAAATDTPAAATNTPTDTATNTATNTPPNTATNTATGTPTNTATAAVTATNTLTPSVTRTPQTPGVIPTTSNPTGTGDQGVRTMANTSFEINDSGCSMTTYEYARVSDMRGWFTSHPTGTASCNGVAYTPNRPGRVIELQKYAAYNYTPEEGSVYAELNADVASMLYQPLCLANNDIITYNFAHRPRGDRTDVAEFRIGIPSGLTTGSVDADSYSRQIVRASTTQSGGVATGAAQTAYTDTATNPTSLSARGWGIYSGTHTLPATGWAGIKNVGFYGITSSASNAGNNLDSITLGLKPILDLGPSRDRSAGEAFTPQALKIRVNGRVGAGSKIALKMTDGDATPDSDFTIGTVTSPFGNASVTHTSGSDAWVITIPAGDYDGGVQPTSNIGFLTVPVLYTTDGSTESNEYAFFNLSEQDVDGATPDLLDLGDPTCDLSSKLDGVVYTITNDQFPTTSSPVGNGTQGSRTMVNTSFENNDSGCAMTTYQYAREADLRGWLTSSPSANATCNGVAYTPNRMGRIIELQKQAVAGYAVQDGTYYAELNASVESMLYQPICFNNSDIITYSFAHRPMGNRTDTAEFRIGIPSGLPTGSRPADTYSRQILRVATTQGSGVVTGGTQTVYTDTYNNTGTISSAKWAVYSGNHVLPSSGWAGIRNVGFVAITGATIDTGNLLDAVTLGLNPIIDLGASRDTTATELASPTSLKIRINGRVAANTKIALKRTSGTATTDSDFRIGTVTAGTYGTATVVHTVGSDTWLITIPAGDYDGGSIPANDTGGLTVPITYIYDKVSEGGEYVKFDLSSASADGATPTLFSFGDPTCDRSEKLDGVVYGITSVDPTATPTRTSTVTPSPTIAGVIPTTSNPTINTANGGSRVMANTSFELYDGTWTQMMDMVNMRGWKTTHRTSDTGYRVMEMWNYGTQSWYDALNGVAAPDGTRWVELNAYHASMLYQPICFADNEQFDFEFYHHPRSFSSTEIIELRFGIPSGLDAGSVAADGYSRQVLRGSSTTGANLAATATALYTSYDGTLNESSTVTTGNWVKYAGSHQLPTGWSGVKNFGFYGISPTGGSGNHLDKITINLQPIIDMGTSRDRSAGEQSTPTALNIRINGRVTADTKIALKQTSGSATADSDFSIGTVSAGTYGNATVVHTSGSDTWLITIPAGDYDGGIVSGNNAGGLSIPVTYSYDMSSEATEHAVFGISSYTDDGATPDKYVLGDPTCDGSQKLDGAVYTITNVDPTNTPTNTPTKTSTPSNTPRPIPRR